MSHTLDCVKQYFNGVPNIAGTLNVLIPSPVASYEAEVKRPFIPVALLFNVGGVPTRGTKLQHTTYKDIFTLLANSILAMSYKKVNNITTGSQYLSGEFGNYLAKKIGGEVWATARFKSIYEDLRNFYSLPFASDVEMNLQFLSKLENLIKVGDKTLLLPPGYFYFADGDDGFSEAVTALVAAVPSFYGIQILEINSL